jgi:AbrB family looped-hinge helix DNA binding protein
MKSTISSKGQITVPVEIREKLGLAPGVVVVFQVTKSGVLIRKGSKGKHPVDRIAGTLAQYRGKSVDDLMDAMRGPRPRPR